LGTQFVLGSVSSAGTGPVAPVGLLRATKGHAFGEAQRPALELVHLGIGPVPCLEGAAPLAPRVLQTFEALLTGASDKEIAVRLGISPHTVRQYVKVILRRHAASSRSQLIARLSSARPAFGACAAPLAPRVQQTLEALLTGASDKEIALRLGISPHTVRQYVKILLRRHAVSSRLQLIVRLSGSSAARTARESA
jgi:DNA-binding NarL/FixJ family response regulator